MIHFEAIQAQHGDSFLLRWNNSLAVIDGGPSGTYPILANRLKTLAKGTPLPIALMMVSHIDDDHINGLVALMRDLRDLKQNKQKLPYGIQRFWFNSFEDLVGAKGKGASAAAAALAANDGFFGGLMKATQDEPTQAVLASVGQGRQLRDLIVFLGLADNQPVDGLVTGSKKAVTIDGLSLQPIGPLDDQLEALRKEWLKKAAQPDKAAEAELAAYLDKSAANLSSIVCLAEIEQKKLLLTGDARGDYILDGLRRYGALQNKGPLELTLLKVPHHGSNRDVAPDFFEALPAEHYVISANGKYNNPDRDTLQWLIEARGTDRYTIHLTNRLDWMDAFFDKLAKGRNFTVNYRGPKDDDIIDIAL